MDINATHGGAITVLIKTKARLRRLAHRLTVERLAWRALQSGRFAAYHELMTVSRTIGGGL